jgi:hypothetical protein
MNTTVATFEAVMQPAPSKARKRVGPVFYPGVYGAKGTYSEADLHYMAATFEPCDVNIEHKKSLLDGLLGKLARAWVGRDTAGKVALFGEWEQPEPLAALLGDAPVPASLEINLKTKKLCGLAITCTPHLTEAALFSAVQPPAPTPGEAARIQRTYEAALSQERARRAVTTATTEQCRDAFTAPILVPVRVPTQADLTRQATDAWFKRASDARKGSK